MTKTCGSCSLCCKIPAIAALGKPPNQWCVHAIPGKGCGIHGAHPDQCKTFQCGWLQANNLGEAWKPTVARFILRIDGPGNQIGVTLDPAHPDAWRRPEYYQTIKGWARSATVFVYLGNQTTVVFPEEDLPVGHTELGDMVRVGYRDAGPLRQPWARVEPVGGQPREYLGQQRVKS